MTAAQATTGLDEWTNELQQLPSSLRHVPSIKLMSHPHQKHSTTETRHCTQWRGEEAR